VCTIIVTSLFWLYHTSCYLQMSGISPGVTEGSRNSVFSSAHGSNVRYSSNMGEWGKFLLFLLSMMGIHVCWSWEYRDIHMNLFSRTRERRVNGLDYDQLDDHLSLLATSYLSVVITRSACFGVLHGSTSSHDVMRWVRIMTSTSGCGFLYFAPCASFPSVDIHVWLPSQWHPPWRYVLHLDT
jgi:hypothetical protein